MTRSLAKFKGPLRGIEEVAWTLALCLCFDAFVYMNTSADGLSAAGDSRPWISSIFLSLYFGAMGYVLLLRRFSLPKQEMFDWLLIGLPMLCFVSSAWSSDPLNTFKKSIIYFGLSAFALSFYWRHGLFGGYVRIWWALVILALLSVVAVFLIPSLAVSHDNHDGAWKGVFSHKNALGAISAFGLISQAILVRARILQSKALRIFGASLFCMTLIGSQSLTAVAAAMVALALGHFAGKPKKSHSVAYRSTVLLIAGISAGLIFKYVSLDQITGVLGKDASATGRVPLWTSVTVEVLRAPWLGYGYETYWSSVEPAYGRIFRAIGFNVTHAHNGYLESALSFGLLIPIAMLIGIGYRIYVFATLPNLRRFDAAAMTSLAAFLIVYNTSETALFVSGGGFWFGFLLLWCHMGRELATCRAEGRKDPHNFNRHSLLEDSR